METKKGLVYGIQNTSSISYGNQKPMNAYITLYKRAFSPHTKPFLHSYLDIPTG